MGNVGTVEGINGGVYAVEIECDRILRVAGPLGDKGLPRPIAYMETELREILDKLPVHLIVRLEDFVAKQGSFVAGAIFTTLR